MSKEERNGHNYERKALYNLLHETGNCRISELGFDDEVIVN